MFDIKIDLKSLDLKLPKNAELKQSFLAKITEIVRQGIERNLFQGIDIRGNAVKPKKSGGRIFYDTGVLFKSVRKKVDKTRASVFLASERAEIGGFLNEDREFFGMVEESSYSQEVNQLILNTPVEDMFDFK